MRTDHMDNDRKAILALVDRFNERYEAHLQLVNRRAYDLVETEWYKQSKQALEQTTRCYGFSRNWQR